MAKRELTLAEIHEGTLEVLKRFISVCDQIGVQYFLAYGSLIGAVRHHGFIPWDDDLDVIMLRPDYEKFREYCNKHEGELTPFRFLIATTRRITLIRLDAFAIPGIKWYEMTTCQMQGRGCLLIFIRTMVQVITMINVGRVF